MGIHFNLLPNPLLKQYLSTHLFFGYITVLEHIIYNYICSHNTILWLLIKYHIGNVKVGTYEVIDESDSEDAKNIYDETILPKNQSKENTTWASTPFEKCLDV